MGNRMIKAKRSVGFRFVDRLDMVLTAGLSGLPESAEVPMFIIGLGLTNISSSLISGRLPPLLSPSLFFRRLLLVFFDI